MRFAVLSSGSKANCTFIEAQGIRILIDCGLSGRETEKRLTSLGVSADTLDAIIVTHEHSDHIMGLATVSKRYKIPIYSNKATGKQLKRGYAHETFVTGETFSVEGLEIESFSIVHDAIDPVGFSIQSEGLKFVQATDLGRVTNSVSEALRGANAVVLESNHDQEMLMSCDYPWVLKQRIASSHGHLSNDCAGALLQEFSHSDLNHVVLAHLSENSNRPDVALKTVKSYLPSDFRFSLAAANIVQPTCMYQVGETALAINS